MDKTVYKQVGEKLYQELIERLQNCEHIALLGPRHGGKALILEEICELAKKFHEIDRPKIIYLMWNEFRGTTQENIIKYFEERFETGSDYETSPTARLSAKIVDIVHESTKTHRQPLWIFVQDILGFPKSIAREILSALHDMKYSQQLNRKIASIVTGSDDFVPLTYGPNSPFRDASHIVISGLDREAAKRYFWECRARQRGKTSRNYNMNSLDTVIKNDAFDWLYEQTGGNPQFIQELIGAVAHHAFTHDQASPSDIWELEETQKWMDKYEKAFLHDSYFPRMILRDIENIDDSFNLLLEVINSENGTVKIKLARRPHQLEVCGLLSCGEDGTARFTSPMMERFVRNSLSERRIADVRVRQGRWNEAWRLYAALSDDYRDRPVSGDARFRLRDVVLDWQASLLDKAHEGINAVVDHFLKGMQYLYGFDSGGLYDKETKLWISGFGNKTATPPSIPNEKPNKQIRDQMYWLNDPLRTYLWSDPGIESRLPERPSPALFLVRDRPGYEIDQSEQKSLWKSLQQFWTAYEAAQDIEYREKIGNLRDKHLRVIDNLHQLLGDIGSVVVKTAELLVNTAGYYRILICLVNAKHERIQAVASYCEDPDLDFSNCPDFHTDFIIPDIKSPKKEKALWDIQQWVVVKNETCTLADASSEMQRSPRTQSKQAKAMNMKAIVVVPMSIGKEVIGTIHFERTDKELPSNEEIQLFEILARQLAVIFRQAQRLTLLQKTVDVIDDHLRLIDPNRKILFLNPKAAEDTGRSSGWQKTMPNCWCREYNQENACLMETATDEGNIHHFRTNQEIDLPKAADWQMARIDDFRKDLKKPFKADGLIGFMERIHDLTPLYNILEDIKSWSKAEGLKDTVKKILETCCKRNYQWCRIYLVNRNTDGKEMLQSYAQFGLEKEENIKRFESGEIKYFRDEATDIQPWHILEQGSTSGPAIYCYDGNRPADDIITDTNSEGLPIRIVGSMQDREYLEKEDVIWIEAPLFVGDKPLGKICLSKPNDFTLGRWGLLNLYIQYASLALENAIFEEQKQDSVAARKTAEMATNILHGLRTPLMTSRICIEDLKRSLEESKFSPEIYELLNDISDETHRMQYILSQYSAHLKGFTPHIEQIDIISSLKKICKAAERSMANLKVKFESGISKLQIKSDITAISEVVGELIYNAQKAGADKITVKADLDKKPEELRISVTDNGPGISEDILSILFDANPNKSSTGTGLGLAIAKNKIDTLGGSINLDATKPGKTMFLLTLPI